MKTNSSISDPNEMTGLGVDGGKVWEPPSEKTEPSGLKTYFSDWSYLYGLILSPAVYAMAVWAFWQWEAGLFLAVLALAGIIAIPIQILALSTMFPFSPQKHWFVIYLPPIILTTLVVATFIAGIDIIQGSDGADLMTVMVGDVGRFLETLGPPSHR